MLTVYDIYLVLYNNNIQEECSWIGQNDCALLHKEEDTGGSWGVHVPGADHGDGDPLVGSAGHPRQSTSERTVVLTVL